MQLFLVHFFLERICFSESPLLSTERFLRGPAFSVGLKRDLGAGETPALKSTIAVLGGGDTHLQSLQSEAGRSK